MVVSEMIAYLLGVHRDLLSLEVWRQMANYYRRSELLKFDMSACRPMACAYGAEHHLRTACARRAHDVHAIRMPCTCHVHDMFEHEHAIDTVRW